MYFAKKPADALASICLERAKAWTDNLNNNGLKDKMRASWRSYYGAFFTDIGNGHQITFSGEQGELVQLGINHYRNLAQHIKIITTTNRPSMDARAINTDYKSQVQAKLATSILDYYMREKRLENYLTKAVEFAVVFGAGYVKMEWDANEGEVYDFIEGTDVPVYEGDIKFSNLSPFDVVLDLTKESANDLDWILVRSYKNKYDLAAKYPEFKEKIEGLETKADIERFSFGINDMLGETDDVPVWEFYHKKTEVLPQGRFLLFLEGEGLSLHDGALPYRTLPIFRISPSDLLGTPYGYTPMFDIIPIQDAMNSLYSTIMTNQNATGVQNIYVPRGADISVNQLVGGLNIIEGNAQAGKPEPLNLTSTPAEIFKFLEMLERSAETISGINSVSRGNPEASLKSGAALALVQSMSLQFISGLQGSYVQLMEDIGGGIVKILQDYAHAPRLITIAGKTNQTYMKEFSSTDLSNVGRVIVDAGNPLSKSIAGRMQLAEQLMQYQIVSNPSQIINLMNTGNLDVLTEGTETELLLIRAENEKLIEGENPPTTIIDDHVQHIKEHRSVLADPDLRNDAALVLRVTQHVQQHIDSLRNGDADLLGILGQPKLAPIGAMQAQPPQQGPMAPPPQGQAQEMKLGKITGPGLNPDGQRMPTMPSIDPGLLPNPGIEPLAELPQQ